MSSNSACQPREKQFFSLRNQADVLSNRPSQVVKRTKNEMTLVLILLFQESKLMSALQYQTSATQL